MTSENFDNKGGTALKEATNIETEENVAEADLNKAIRDYRRKIQAEEAMRTEEASLSEKRPTSIYLDKVANATIQALEKMDKNLEITSEEREKNEKEIDKIKNEIRLRKLTEENEIKELKSKLAKETEDEHKGMVEFEEQKMLTEYVKKISNTISELKSSHLEYVKSNDKLISSFSLIEKRAKDEKYFSSEQIKRIKELIGDMSEKFSLKDDENLSNDELEKDINKLYKLATMKLEAIDGKEILVFRLISEKINYNRAREWCIERGCRLPTMEELESLYLKGGEAILIFEGKTIWAVKDDKGNTYTFNFNNGKKILTNPKETVNAIANSSAFSD